MPSRQAPDPEHAAALLWGERQRPARGPKPGLTLGQIVAEGIALADAEGLEALSMKRLAERLGAGTMSLYRYVAGKEELINLMFDAAVDASELPPSQDWRERVATWARRQRDFYQAHPWALSVVITPRPMGPQELTVLESALEALSDTGLRAEEAMSTVLLVNGFVRGVAQHADTAQQGTPVDPVHYVRKFQREADYPTLLQVESEMGEPTDDGFEYGLARILDGIAMHIGR